MSSLGTGPEEFVIIGGGPAALATIVGLKGADLIRNQPVVVIDPAAECELGSGGFWGAAIASNSAGKDFVEPIAGCESLGHVASTSEAQPLIGQEGSVPLAAVANFLSTATATILRRGLARHVKDSVVAIEPGQTSHRLRTASGEIIRAARVIIATGASEQLLPELRQRSTAKTFTSSEVVHQQRPEVLSQSIADDPRVVILGGSHSTYSAAQLVLAAFPDVSITLAKRGPSRPFFESVQAAQASGHDVDHLDVCPETGRVNRFNGLRGAALGLWQAEQRGQEPRLSTVYGLDLSRLDPEVTVIQAIGYRRRRVGLETGDGTPIRHSVIKASQGLARLVVAGCTEPLRGVYCNGHGFSQVDGFNVYCGQATRHFARLNLA